MGARDAAYRGGAFCLNQGISHETNQDPDWFLRQGAQGMTADPLSNPEPTRRRVIEVFLGGGLLASFASFIYPVLRYLVPPAMANLGGDEVVAAKVP